MAEDLQSRRAGITQQDFSVIQGSVSALRLMIDDKRIHLSDIAADVGTAYQRFATGKVADMEAAVKAVAKSRDSFAGRVSSWQRDLRAALAGAPKTLKTKLEGQLNMGAGRAHNISNSFETLIGRLEKLMEGYEQVAPPARKPAQYESAIEEHPTPREAAAKQLDEAAPSRIPALRTVVSDNGLALAEVLTDRPTRSAEAGDRLIVYHVNNFTKIGDVIRDDREPELMQTEYGEIRRPVIGSIPFASGGVTGTVAGEYKVNHVEVRSSFRSDNVLKHGITLTQQVREGNILYVYLAKREP